MRITIGMMTFIIMNKTCCNGITIHIYKLGCELWALDGSWKISLLLNDQGQLIGPDSKIFTRWLGTFCYNGLLCPLVPTRWPKVLDKYKQDCWMEIEVI